jgi:hypothetical protein
MLLLYHKLPHPFSNKTNPKSAQKNFFCQDKLQQISIKELVQRTAVSRNSLVVFSSIQANLMEKIEI